jgi:hypothetical protein
VTGAGTLGPVIALAAWTMVMWAWMYATRLPAIGSAKVDLDELVRDPATSLDDLLPVGVQWKAHNYNHLHEAPTVFYAVAIVLAIIGAGDGLNAQLAWGYVALRVVHSLVQATINKVSLRFVLFALSSVVLMVLVARAVMVMF